MSTYHTTSSILDLPSHRALFYCRYIKEASERICTCLKKDFAQFLPPLLPGIFRNLRVEEMHAPDTGAEGDEDSYVKVQTGDGKLLRVHTEKFQDMMQSAPGTAMRYRAFER